MEKKSVSKDSKNEDKEIAAAYIRVSTLKQKREGYSTDVQTEFAKKYAEEKNWKLQDDLIFKEEKPASTVEGRELNKSYVIDSFKNRPKLHELMIKIKTQNTKNIAENKKIKHLIVHTRDRLSRSLEESIVLNAYFEKYGVDIHYTKEGQNLNNEDKKINRLLHIILSSIAELESNILSTRIKNANKACLSKGWWPGGKAPLGYYRKQDYDDDTQKYHSFLVKSDFESKIIKRIFDYYIEGLGYRRIADKMNKEYPFIRWSKSKIESIIKNQTYTGQVAWDRRGGRRTRKKHENISLSALNEDNIIIAKDSWYSSNDIRKQRSIHKDAFYYDTPFIFKGKLICAKCNRVMKPKNPGRNKSNVYKCANTKSERSQCNCILPSYIIEKEFNTYMKNTFKIKNSELLWETYNSEFDRRISECKELINSINIKLKECTPTISKLEKFISEEKDSEIKSALKTQYAVLSKLINEYKYTKNLAEEKIYMKKLNKQDFDKFIKESVTSIFIDDNNLEKSKANEIKKKQREFINLFVDKIIVDYNSKDKKIESLKIEFILPKLI